MYEAKMSHGEFRGMMTSEWRESDRERILREAAEEYHRRCESFDRTRCTGRSPRGLAIPQDARERAEIGRNAARVRREMRRELEGWGYTAQEIQDAIVRTSGA